MFRKRVLSAILTLLPIAAGADTIVLAADPWCPYNCEPGGERPGFMVGVAREALEPYGHTIEYRSIAWARALAQAEAGTINGVIGAIPEEAPTFVFGSPIGTYEDTVVFRKGEAFEVNSPDDLSGLRIGAINGYEYYGPVSQYIDKHRNDRTLVQYASGDDALSINLRKLAAGRLDLVAEVRAVLDYRIAELGLESALEIVRADPQSDLYIAFSPALETSGLYVSQLSEGVARLRESGRYQEILGAYGLSE